VHVVTPRKYSYDGELTLGVPCDGIAVHEVAYPGRWIAGDAPSEAGMRPAGGRWTSAKRWTRQVRRRMGFVGDPRTWAVPALLHAAADLTRRHAFDLLVSTYGPASAHIVAGRIARRTGLPWLADYQDLWTDNYADPPGRLSRMFHRWFERRVMRPASMLATLSDGLAARLQSLLGRPCAVSYFGYVDMPAAPIAAPDDRVHLVYTGRVYPDHQTVRPLFAAIRQALDARPELHRSLAFDFYGPEQRPLRQLAAAYGTDRVTRFHGEVPPRTARGLQGGAAALLFLDWAAAGAPGVLPAKLFEYVQSWRPIAFFGRGTESEASRLVRDCRGGIILQTAEAQRQFLLDWPAAVPDRRGADLVRIAQLSCRQQGVALILLQGHAVRPLLQGQRWRRPRLSELHQQELAALPDMTFPR
jgi:glycosyltransferase involved in cell wall biosynthesis